MDSKKSLSDHLWRTLVILGLITEKLIMPTLTFPGLHTYRARVQCTSSIPLS